MKYMNRLYILLVFALFSTTVANAQLQDELWNRAAGHYSASNYDEAAATYEQLMEYGASASLYYNYAGALFKQGEIGKAILYYERALRLDPFNDDIKANLAFANRQKTDFIEPIPQFFVAEWIDALGNLFTSNMWANISVFSFSITLLLVLIYLFGRRRWLRKLGFFMAVFALLVSIVAFTYAFSIKQDEQSQSAAIVMAGSVSVTSAPDVSGTEVFVVHEGTKVFVRETLGDWCEVRLEDGRMGWLQSSTIERI